MNWQAFLSTFAMLFVAELGDKTQIAAMLQAANFKSPWSVWAGAALALALVSGLGVCVGHVCGNFLPRDLIRYVAGAIFVVMGVLMLLGIMGK